MYGTVENQCRCETSESVGSLSEYRNVFQPATLVHCIEQVNAGPNVRAGTDSGHNHHFGLGVIGLLWMISSPSIAINATTLVVVVVVVLALFAIFKGQCRNETSGLLLDSFSN